MVVLLLAVPSSLTSIGPSSMSMPPHTLDPASPLMLILKFQCRGHGVAQSEVTNSDCV